MSTPEMGLSSGVVMRAANCGVIRDPLRASICEGNEAKPNLGSSENTLTAGSNAFVFFGRLPQWVRFFE